MKLVLLNGPQCCGTRRLVGVDVSHWNPHILHLSGMIQKLFTGCLLVTGPVSAWSVSVVDPRPLNAICGGVFHKRCCIGAAGVVPDGLDVLVFWEVLGEMVAVTGNDVNHSTGNVRRVKYLHKLHSHLGLNSILVSIDLTKHFFFTNSSHHRVYTTPLIKLPSWSWDRTTVFWFSFFYSFFPLSSLVRYVW